MIFPTKQERLAFLNRALEDYSYYFKHFVWPTLNSHIELVDSPVIDFMCQLAQAFYQQEYRFLSLALPPRNTKTTIFTLGLPTWIWLKDPKRDIMTSSASDDVIINFHAERQILFQSADYLAFYELLHGPEKLQWAKTSVNHCDNSFGGQFLQWKSTKSRTGLGFDFGILDDPISVSDAFYKNYCDKIFRETVQGHLNRRHNKNIGYESPFLVIQQRVSPHDLIGKFQEKEGWVHYALPAIAYQRQELVMPITKEIWVREPGSVLNASRESLDTLLKIRDADERIFWCQFQQNPAEDKSEQVLDPSELRYYIKKPEEIDKLILSVDSAGSKGVNSANWGLVVLAKVGEEYYVVFTEAKKYNYPEGKKRVKDMVKDLNIDELYIEDKSTGIALIPELTVDYKNQNIKIIGIQPGKLSKDERFLSALQYIKAKCLFPKLTAIPDAVWSMPLMAELTEFPNSPTMDLSDALSQYFYHVYFKTKKRPSLKDFYGMK